MKRFLLSIFIFSNILFCLIAVTPKEVTYNPIPVEFTSGVTHYAGFVKQRVSGTIKPADSEFLNGLEFDSFDSSGLNYTTGDFYFFIQVFDQNPIAVDIISASPLEDESGNSLSYSNTGSNTMGIFRNSDDNISESDSLKIFSEINSSVDYLKPRVNNLRFNFNIPIEDITVPGSYRGTITLKIHTES